MDRIARRGSGQLALARSRFHFSIYNELARKWTVTKVCRRQLFLSQSDSSRKSRRLLQRNATAFLNTRFPEHGYLEDPYYIEEIQAVQKQYIDFDLRTLREETRKFLDGNHLEAGTMSLKAFEEGRKMLVSWSQMKSLESVDKSIALLERLVLEQNSNFNPELSELEINQSLNYSLVNALVKNWYHCWKEATETGENMITPQQLYSKIEDWSALSPNLQLQTSTITTIMRGIVYRIKTPQEAAIVESLLIKMVEDFQAGNNCLTPSIVEYNILMNAMAKVKDPDRAETILMRLIQDYENGASQLKPDYVSFASVLHAWKHAQTSDAGKRAEAILDLMIDFGMSVGDRSISKPKDACYNAVIYAYCNVRAEENLRQAERFLDRMQSDFRSGNMDARPSEGCYSLLINAWSQLGRGEESEKILRQMYDDFALHGNEKAHVSCRHFNSAITAWTRSEAPYALHKAWALFESMKSIGIEHDKSTYGALLHCMSRSKHPQIGKMADKLMHDQKRRFTEGDEDFKLDALNYNVAMHCWSSLGNAERVEELLAELLDEHMQGNLQIEDDRPFCTAIAAWSRSRSARKTEQAEAIFHEMNRLIDSGRLDFQPTANCFGALQGCWAGAEKVDSGQKCLSLLSEMRERFVAGYTTLKPTEANYKVVIDAFSRTGKPREAVQFWYQMIKDFAEGVSDVKPGSESCRAVLKSWLMSESLDAIDRTLEILDHLAEVEKSQIVRLNLDIDVYHLTLDICSKCSSREILAGAESIVLKMEELHCVAHRLPAPDARCYNIAMNCWGKLGRADRAEALFWDIQNRNSRNAKTQAKPDTFSISTVLSAWSRSRADSAPRRAEIFFEKVNKLLATGSLETMKLDLVCYNALLNCLANARTEEAAERAEEIFRNLRQQSLSGYEELQPNENSYFSLIKCLTRVGRAERAEELLFEMAQLFSEGRNDLRLKSKRPFAYVLTAWLQSSAYNAPDRAEKLLHWMVQQHEMGAAKECPDALNYASVLRCWTRSRRPDSGKRAEDLLVEMKEQFGNDQKWVQSCFSDVICAWARSGNVKKAESLLLQRAEDFLRGKSNIVPENRAFVAVFAAIEKSSKPSSASLRALRLIDMLRRVDDITRTKVNVALEYWDSLSQDTKENRLLNFVTYMEELDGQHDAIDTTQKFEEDRHSDPSLAIKL